MRFLIRLFYVKLQRLFRKFFKTKQTESQKPSRWEWFWGLPLWSNPELRFAALLLIAFLAGRVLGLAESLMTILQ